MFLKTPVQCWTGVLLFWLLHSPVIAACLARGELRTAVLEEVVDGDTLRLADGRLVRLIGINTPELGRDGAPDQDLAVEARLAVLEWLDSRTLLLAEGSEPRDRHGRTLAAVFRQSDRASLSEHLIAEGLGWQVTVPPNTAYAGCLMAAEAQARRAGRGVWGLYPVLAAKSLSQRDVGFQRVSGRVSRVVRAGKAYWIELDDQLSLRLDRRDQNAFPGLDLPGLLGQRLTVRGWLIYREGVKARHPAHMMQLSHPAMLELVEE